MRLAVALVATMLVAACAWSGESSTPLAHPALECSGKGSGTGNYDLIGPGFETAAEALGDRLGYYKICTAARPSRCRTTRQPFKWVGRTSSSLQRVTHPAVAAFSCKRTTSATTTNLNSPERQPPNHS